MSERWKVFGWKTVQRKTDCFSMWFYIRWNGETLVIGKAAKPRCFQNLDIRKLPVEWRSNKKAWMTSQIMEEWLTAFNGRMKMQNRHVLLFLDNATCHPHIKLSNVRLAWFPPNTTSVSQPMDQGIIRNVNPLKPELNSICYLLALLGAHHFLHVSRIRVKLLTLRWLMSYIYIWSTHSWCF